MSTTWDSPGYLTCAGASVKVFSSPEFVIIGQVYMHLKMRSLKTDARCSPQASTASIKPIHAALPPQDWPVKLQVMCLPVHPKKFFSELLEMCSKAIKCIDQKGLSRVLG